MKKYLPVLLMFLFPALGCASLETVESTRIAPSEISQSYRILSGQNSTSVTATFYSASGATIDLDAPTRIELNGKEMSESKPFFLKGTDYHYDSSRFESSFQFALYTADGQVYHNEITVAPLEISARDFTLSRSRETEFQLSRAVAPDERISFSLRSQSSEAVSTETNANNFNANAQSNERFFADGAARLNANRNSFTLDPSQLEKFAAGKASLKIEVSKSADVRQSPGRGGTLSITYESQEIAVNVVK